MYAHCFWTHMAPLRNRISLPIDWPSDPAQVYCEVQAWGAVQDLSTYLSIKLFVYLGYIPRYHYSNLFGPLLYLHTLGRPYATAPLNGPHLIAISFGPHPRHPRWKQSLPFKLWKCQDPKMEVAYHISGHCSWDIPLHSPGTATETHPKWAPMKKSGMNF